MKGVSVVMPCYKEDPKIVTKTYCELTMLGAEVIVVDDGSTMDLPDDVKVISYSPNMGYGYAIKQGIQACTNPIVMTLDGDGQHTSEDAEMLCHVYKRIGDVDMVIGQRWDIKEVWYRTFFRKCLNFLASVISGHYQVDLNSGMRIFRRDLALGYSPILCDTFSFTTSFTMAMTTDKHKICYVPIHVKPRANGKSKVKLIRDGWITLYYIVWVGLALRTRGLRRWLFGRST